MSDERPEPEAPPPPSRLKSCLLLSLFGALLAAVAVVGVTSWLTGRAVEDIRRDFGQTEGVRERVGTIQRAVVDWKQTDTAANRFVFRVEGDRGRGTIVAIHTGVNHPDMQPGWTDAHLILPTGEVVPLDDARGPTR